MVYILLAQSKPWRFFFWEGEEFKDFQLPVPFQTYSHDILSQHGRCFWLCKKKISHQYDFGKKIKFKDLHDPIP